MSKLVFLGVCVFFLMTVHSLSLYKPENKKDSSEENKENFQVLESLREFVAIVDKYNLNVSIVGSQKEYASGGWLKKDTSVTIHMPVDNNGSLTEATLNDDKQDKYLTKLKKLAKKENVGVKTRVIKIENGEDKVVDQQEVNKEYLIDSPSYKLLTNFKNGVQGFAVPENSTNEILYNYVITNASEPVRNIQVITSQVIINDLDVSEDFPTKTLQETKNILPKLWLSIDDELLLARLLVQHLDKKFDGNHQVLIGVDKFALSGKKFAKLEVGDSNVLVFIL